MTTQEACSQPFQLPGLRNACCKQLFFSTASTLCNLFLHAACEGQQCRHPRHRSCQELSSSCENVSYFRPISFQLSFPFPLPCSLSSLISSLLSCFFSLVSFRSTLCSLLLSFSALCSLLSSPSSLFSLFSPPRATVSLHVCFSFVANPDLGFCDAALHTHSVGCLGDHLGNIVP